MNLRPLVLRIAKKEHSRKARLLLIAGAALVFVIGIPALFVWIAFHFGRTIHYEFFYTVSTIGLLCMAAGLALIVWTSSLLFRKARGTPAPFMSTKKLLTDGPYALCRNPMVLGVILYYSGIAILSRSYYSILTVFIYLVCLVVIVRLAEEKEMEIKFGEEYLMYRKRTPFIIPRIKNPPKNGAKK